MAQSPANPPVAHVSAHVLAHVPGCEREAPLAVVPLASGSSHSAVLVRTRVGEYVVRVRRAGARSAATVRRECLLQSAAADAGLAPQMLWADSRTVITRYVAGRIWAASDLADAQRIERLGRWLCELHALSPPALAPFDAVATAERYRSAIVPVDVEDAARLDAGLEEIRIVAARLAAQPRPVAIIHGDVHHTNVVEGERLVLIDWEYAALADPLFDLGCVLAYSPPAHRHAARLLAAAGLANSATLDMLWHACRLYEQLTALWSRAAASALPYGAGATESAD